MFLHEDFYLPDGESHFVMEGLANYQSEQREGVYGYVRNWDRALDIGANIGIFSRDFAKHFAEVVAFEPIPGIRECLARNVPDNVRIMPFALSDAPTTLHMSQLAGGCGGSYIFDHPEIPAIRTAPKQSRLITVEARTLDSFGFDVVDLIKIDVQDAELVALKGARETILRTKPVILVEEKPRLDDAESVRSSEMVIEYLLSLGMTQREKFGGDRVYTYGTSEPRHDHIKGERRGPAGIRGAIRACLRAVGIVS